MNADEIVRKLTEAVEIVEKADLPLELRPKAFERVLDAVGLTATPTAIAPSGASDGSGGAGSPSLASQNDGSGLLSQIARKLDLPVDQISLVYGEQEGAIELIVRRSMLPEPSKKAAAARDISLLVAAGRQAAGLEEWTPMSVVREECSELGVLDPSNFATEVAKLGWKVQGSRAAKEIRATRHHLELAAQLIARIAEGASV